MVYSLPCSSIHGILKARILEWDTTPSSRESSQPRDWTHMSCSSCSAGRFFTTEPLEKPLLSPTPSIIFIIHTGKFISFQAGDVCISQQAWGFTNKSNPGDHMPREVALALVPSHQEIQDLKFPSHKISFLTHVANQGRTEVRRTWPAFEICLCYLTVPWRTSCENLAMLPTAQLQFSLWEARMLMY